ncbi:hypothetical protein [Mesorhizobium sp. SP-1A]|uniref:hypothetical protein n=1 Tax=Mesorhizobium sp. SP-1A TaxID=3077840 RepID=UPI0028F73EFE|nr:hypothetical protein [Mesorhizobium sp. SP-1A]
MNVTTPVKPVSITRPIATASIFVATGRETISIRGGTEIGTVKFLEDTPILPPLLEPGTDYAVRIEDGNPMVYACGGGLPDGAIGGFHFAPGGNADEGKGGDAQPAINPASCWDVGFRPACPDPRGMALVERDGLRFWCDIYLLGVDHVSKGTSRFGDEIADGRSLPASQDGKGKVKKLDYATAVAIYVHHGKQLLGAEEFFAAAYGVRERSSAKDDPERTNLDAERTSCAGIMQATGNMWIWGTDGHPVDPRPSLFGGSWLHGGHSGSRYALLVYWPDYSGGSVSARGRSDHLAA